MCSAAYGGAQARGPIGAVAASLHHSRSHAGSELHQRPAPQLMATHGARPGIEPTSSWMDGNSRTHQFFTIDFIFQSSSRSMGSETPCFLLVPLAERSRVHGFWLLSWSPLDHQPSESKAVPPALQLNPGRVRAGSRPARQTSLGCADTSSIYPPSFIWPGRPPPSPTAWGTLLAQVEAIVQKAKAEIGRHSSRVWCCKSQDMEAT